MRKQGDLVISEHTGEMDALAWDMQKAQQIAEKLHSVYPGHLWAVGCDSHQGVVVIRNLRFGERFGFYLKLKDLENDPLLKKVVMAGGEFLERYRLSRGRYSVSEYSQLHQDCGGIFKPEM